MLTTEFVDEEVDLGPDPEVMRQIDQLRQRRVVQLVRNGAFLDMVPECTGLLGDFFTVQHAAVADAEHGVSLERVRVPLVWTDSHLDLGVPITRAYAGMQSLIKQRLDERGLHVLDDGTAAPPLSSPSHLVTLATNGMDFEVDKAMLDMVQRQDLGVVRYSGAHVDPARLVAQIALAWPKMRIIVAVTRREHVWGIRKRLCSQYCLKKWEVTAFTGGSTPDRPGRVRITTYACAAEAGVGGWTPSIFLALNPTEMLSNSWADWGMEIMKHTRMYAMLPMDRDLTQFQRDQISARFGLDEVRIPQHGMVERPANVVFCSVYGGPKLPRNASLVELLRAGIWKHPVRNRRIATIAKAVATGDSDRLRKEFCEAFPRMVSPRRRRTVVLVANVEQALVLAKKLPEWPIVVAKGAMDAGLSAEAKARLERGNGSEMRKCRALVTTAAGLPRIGRIDVLIRADAGVGLPSGCIYNNVIGERGMNIVDFLDKQHPELLARSKKRKLAYKQAGWTLVDDNRSQLQKFLDQRPKVDVQ